MQLSFLTPLAGLVTLAAAIPLIAFIGSERRAARVRASLGLAPPAGSQRQVAAVIAVLAAMVGAGAAQPVLERTKEQTARSDAQAFFVLDTSRSMLARGSPDDPTRFDRAREAAIRFRDELRTVPVGIASLTDRALPLMFPSANRDSVVTTLELAIDVDRPPSAIAGDVRASSFGALAAVGSRNFFRGAKRRLLVVFTDAETSRFNPQGIARSLAEGNVQLIVVRFGSVDERVFDQRGAPEPYRPDPASGKAARSLASAAGGEAFVEDDLDDAIAAAKRMIGEGETVTRSRETDVIPLAPYVFLTALLPLGVLLFRRNLA